MMETNKSWKTESVKISSHLNRWRKSFVNVSGIVASCHHQIIRAFCLSIEQSIRVDSSIWDDLKIVIVIAWSDAVFNSTIVTCWEIRKKILKLVQNSWELYDVES